MTSNQLFSTSSPPAGPRLPANAFTHVLDSKERDRAINHKIHRKLDRSSLISPLLGIVAVVALALSATTVCSAATGGDQGATVGDPIAVDESVTVELAAPKGSDPLTPSEIARAKSLAERSQRVQRARSGGGLARPNALQRLQRVQYLYAERSQDVKADTNTGRRANVFFYNYANDEIIRQVVDLRAGAAIETSSAPVESQPAVTSTETDAGVQLILDHPQLGPGLRSSYEQLSGQPLTRIDQLHAQAGIYRVSHSGATPLAAISDACRQHRCIQFLLPYSDGKYIDASNLVVDLSAGQVLWVDEGLTAHIDAELPAESSASGVQ